MDEERVYTYEPPVSKEWIDQGSMQELSEEVIANTRPKVLIQTFFLLFNL